MHISLSSVSHKSLIFDLRIVRRVEIVNAKLFGTSVLCKEPMGCGGGRGGGLFQSGIGQLLQHVNSLVYCHIKLIILISYILTLYESIAFISTNFIKIVKNCLKWHEMWLALQIRTRQNYVLSMGNG